MGERKVSEESDAKELRVVLDDNMTDKAILVRDHACGYTLLNELYRYDETLVLTAESEKVNTLLLTEDEVTNEDTIVMLVDCKEDVMKPVFKEIKALGYQVSQMWCDDGTMGAYVLTK